MSQEKTREEILAEIARFEQNSVATYGDFWKLFFTVLAWRVEEMPGYLRAGINAVIAHISFQRAALLFSGIDQFIRDGIRFFLLNDGEEAQPRLAIPEGESRANLGAAIIAVYNMGAADWERAVENRETLAKALEHIMNSTHARLTRN